MVHHKYPSRFYSTSQQGCLQYIVTSDTDVIDTALKKSQIKLHFVGMDINQSKGVEIILNSEKI